MDKLFCRQQDFVWFLTRDNLEKIKQKKNLPDTNKLFFELKEDSQKISLKTDFT